MKRLHWSLYFLAWVGGLSALGSAIGALIFPLLGLVLDWKFSARELVLNGARNLGFFFFVWGVPIGAIAAVMRAKHRNAPPPTS